MKNLLFSILLLTTLQTTFAQEPIGFIALVGTNIPNYKSNDVIATPGKPSPFVGLGFNFGYHETYNYQFEFAYAQHNVNFENFDSTERNYNFGGILQAGFYLTYYIIKPEEDKFYFGSQAGINMIFGSAESKNGFSSQDRFEPSGIDGINVSNSSVFNYGAGIGLTGVYNKFRLNLRYNYGLSNTLRTIGKKVPIGSYSSGGNPYTGKLSSISCTIGYRVFSKN